MAGFRFFWAQQCALIAEGSLGRGGISRTFCNAQNEAAVKVVHSYLTAKTNHKFLLAACGPTCLLNQTLTGLSSRAQPKRRSIARLDICLSFFGALWKKRNEDTGACPSGCRVKASWSGPAGRPNTTAKPGRNSRPTAKPGAENNPLPATLYS